MFKKILFGISTIAIALLGHVGVAHAGPWQYIVEEKGEAWPSWQERVELAAECGIWKYKGTYDQNVALEACMREIDAITDARDEGLLGYSVVTRYRTTLQSSMTSSQTTVPVSSITSFDGTTLTMDLLGESVFLTIEPGSTREEIVKCTTISSSQFATCTRGLAFTGTSESAVAANQKAHRAGSIVVMSNVHYVYEQVVDKDTTETITGQKTFTSSTDFSFLPTTTTTLPTAANQIAQKAYVDGIAISGSPTSTETIPGISQIGTQSEIANGTFSSSSPTHVATNWTTSTPQVTGNYVPVSESDGKLNQNWLDLTEDYTWSGVVTSTGKHTFNNIVNTPSTTDWQLGGISASTTMILINESASFHEATDITGAEAETLTDGSNADLLHIHNYTTLIDTASTTNDGGTVSTASTTLWEANIDADTLESGNVLEVTLNITHTLKNVNTSYSLVYGGEEVTSFSFDDVDGKTGNGIIKAQLMGAGSTSSQEGNLYISIGTNSFIVDNGTTVNGVGIGSSSGSSSVDSTSDQTLRIFAAKDAGSDKTITVNNAFAVVHKTR